MLNNALKLSPDAVTADEWYFQGSLLFTLGRNGDARTSYEKALAMDQGNASFWWRHGLTLDCLGLYEESLQSHSHALKLSPLDQLIWLGYADSLADLGRYQEALESVNHAISLPPTSADAAATLYLFKALLELHFGQTDEALQSWRTAISFDLESLSWSVVAFGIFLEAIKMGHRTFVRKLIEEAQMEETFFPLIRAMDYLATGDEALIETLTPEMRPIVEEVVASLRTATETAPPPKTPPGKRTRATSGSQRTGRRRHN